MITPVVSKLLPKIPVALDSIKNESISRKFCTVLSLTANKKELGVSLNVDHLMHV